MGKLYQTVHDDREVGPQLSDMKRIKNIVSIEAMRQCTKQLQQYPLVAQVPPSMIGLFYVFTALVNSELEDKQELLDACRVVTGLVGKEELHWLEIGAWYIFADSKECLDIGPVDKTVYKLISSHSAMELYQKLRSESSLNINGKKYYT